MIKTIKLDGVNNYYIDKNTGEPVEKYEDGKDLRLRIKLNNSILEIESDKLTKQFDNQVIVQHNDDRYIIDDGYANVLIKCGYIVFHTYDEINVDPEDKDFGVILRDGVISEVRRVLKSLNVEYNFKDGVPPEEPTLEFSGKRTILETENEQYKYTFVIDTISSMVNKNQTRKDNDLTFYPFKKNMDKYGTLYLSVFCQKKNPIKNETSRAKYTLPDKLINSMIKKLNENNLFHYTSNTVSKRVVYYRNM